MPQNETSLGSTVGHGPTPSEPQTLGQVLDQQLEYAREQVLAICEAKAKAEFLGLLNAPFDDVYKLIHPRR